jgi:Fic family protein
MNLKLETEFSTANILGEVDALKKQIDEMHPLPEDVEGKVMQKLRLDWNYHSNAIEGNRLSYGETVAFLMEGITAKGKPLKDHLDIRGHNEAINFLLAIVKDTRQISETDIRNLHTMVLVEPYTAKATTAEGLPTTKRITLGEYKTSANHVKTATGEIHYYATPEDTPAKMQELMDWYSKTVNNKIVHPVVVAALFHHQFVSIHPFDDGNGRLSRILMNLILMQNGFPPVVIKMDDRQNYYALLNRADNNDKWPFIEYIAERLQSSLKLYLKAASGGDIDEDEDIDKEIALFKMESADKIYLKEKRSIEKIKNILLSDVIDLFINILIKIKPLHDLFFQVEASLTFSFSNGETKASNHRYRDITTLFNEKRVPEIIDLIEREQEEYSKTIFKIFHIEFKNSDNMFSLTDEIKIEFAPFGYSITIFDNQIISKPYNESLNAKEKKEVVNDFARRFMNSLREQQKSPKS